MVVRVDLISGTFSLVLQDLALRKSTWSEVEQEKERDKVNLAVAKGMPNPICLKLTAGKGFPASIFPRLEFLFQFRDHPQRCNYNKRPPLTKKIARDYCKFRFRRLLLIQQRLDRSPLLQKRSQPISSKFPLQFSSLKLKSSAPNILCDKPHPL
jgi:hypothetical protein